MVNIKVVLRFFERDFVAKLLFFLLLYSLLPLLEIFLILYLGGNLGNYLTLALAASTGLLGVVIARVGLREAVGNLKSQIRSGTYPGREFVNLAGILLGGILLLTPGFVTDLLGFLFFVPIVRNMVGSMITRSLESELREVYEYLRLYDL